MKHLVTPDKYFAASISLHLRFALVDPIFSV